MRTRDLKRLNSQDLRALTPAVPAGDCTLCGGLRCPGWEATSTSFDEVNLTRVGTLRGPEPGGAEPTLEEYHPLRTNYWSADAPIAPNHYPYNLCEVWACRACGRPFLRYTEYGGYYVEPRIRWLNPDLVVDVA